jgi:adenosylcobinamide-GDP ribazoletransferase
MPRFEWKEDDMATSLDFFPLVGLVIAALVSILNIGPLTLIDPYVRAILSVLIPILITGGFHLDGFMDTSDALNSYGEHEKKLEILKDPHIGAFSVISLVKLILIAVASSVFILTSEELTKETVLSCSLIFVVSRCISGLTSLFLKKAKKSGMLSKEAGNMRKGTVALLSVQLIAAAGAMIVLDPVSAIPALAFFAGYTLYYKYKTKKEFGGVTGDTAGLFVSVSETGAACMIALVILVLRFV